MQRPNLVLPIWSAFIIVFTLSLCPTFAATAVVRDGDTIQLGDMTYRLDGVDAPELDQICIDDHADPFNCGIDAREQLSKLIGGRSVHCDDLGPDKTFRNRHLGICGIDGDATSLNQQLVRLGRAVSVEPAAKLHLREDATSAKADNRGLWKGCFVAPREFRAGKKDGALLGGSCRSDRDSEIRAVLFPEETAMPPGCSIKGKFAVRARVTGNVGIYHLRGCPSYAGLAGPDRWFCSEDDARAAGFRRAFNCRAGRSK
jgi:endonuclease YncB( thermonuclease family)